MRGRVALALLVVALCAATTATASPGGKVTELEEPPSAGNTTAPLANTTAPAPGPGKSSWEAIPGDLSVASAAGDVKKVVLPNGLTVLIKEVHTVPVVTAQVWYRVGSRNEPPGFNGLSHFLEHSMFKGTTDRPVQFGRLFSVIGSLSNAFTTYDKTVYYGTVGRLMLKSILELEADRMTNVVLDQKELFTEKNVVSSELEGYEGSPSFRLNLKVMKAAFPNHPYGLPVGGFRRDVESLSVKAAKEYYQRHYAPQCAVLVVVGDVNADEAVETATDIFGGVNAPNNTLCGSQSMADVPQPQPGPKKVVVAGMGYMLLSVYPLPAAGHPDVPALDVLKEVLSYGKASVLKQQLMGTHAAIRVGASSANLIDFGWLKLFAIPVKGNKLENLDKELMGALDWAKTNPVDEEQLRRAKRKIKLSVILARRSVTGLAKQLGDAELTLGNYQYVDQYLEDISAVGAEQIMTVAKKWLNHDQRTVGYYIPSFSAFVKRMHSVDTTPKPENFIPKNIVNPAELTKYLPDIPEDEDSTFTSKLPEKYQMANGVRVYLKPDATTPAVTISGYIDAGMEFDPMGKGGASAVTALMLMAGAAERDGILMAKLLNTRGAHLSFSPAREGVRVSGFALSEDVPLLMEILSDCLQRATFPENKLKFVKMRVSALVRGAMHSPLYHARRMLQTSIFPPHHPFSRFPTPASVAALSRADISMFYQRNYQPQSTALFVEGNFDPAAMKQELEKNFGDWKSDLPHPVLSYPPVKLPDGSEPVRHNIPMFGLKQSYILMGHIGLKRRDPRYYASMILNKILGGDTLSSRLGMEVRDRAGLTYGITSVFETGLLPGMFHIKMQTAPGDVDKAINHTMTVLHDIRNNGVTQTEMEQAKKALIRKFPVILSNMDTYAHTVLMYSVYGLGMKELTEFQSKIDAVTLDELNGVTKELIHPKQMVIIVAGAFEGGAMGKHGYIKHHKHPGRTGIPAGPPSTEKHACKTECVQTPAGIKCTAVCPGRSQGTGDTQALGAAARPQSAVEQLSGALSKTKNWYEHMEVQQGRQKWVGDQASEISFKECMLKCTPMCPQADFHNCAMKCGHQCSIRKNIHGTKTVPTATPFAAKDKHTPSFLENPDDDDSDEKSHDDDADEESDVPGSNMPNAASDPEDLKAEKLARTDVGAGDRDVMPSDDGDMSSGIADDAVADDSKMKEEEGQSADSDIDKELASTVSKIDKLDVTALDEGKAAKKTVKGNLRSVPANTNGDDDDGDDSDDDDSDDDESSSDSGVGGAIDDAEEETESLKSLEHDSASAMEGLDETDNEFGTEKESSVEDYDAAEDDAGDDGKDATDSETG